MRTRRFILLAPACCLTVALRTSPTQAARPASDDEPTPRATLQRSTLELAIEQYEKAVAKEAHDSAAARELYRQALAGFLRVIRDGRKNGYLYYNAANVQMRLRRLGPAIANYRRARQLLPGDVDVRRNLEYARSLCEVRIQSPARANLARTLLSWHFDTPQSTRSAVALTAYGVFWLLLLSRLLGTYYQKHLPGLGWTALAAASIALTSAASVAWDQYAGDQLRGGVIVSETATLRKGNGEAYQPQLDRPLSEGVEFRILDERPDAGANLWYHVQLADGKDGWLRADQTEVF